MADFQVGMGMGPQLRRRLGMGMGPQLRRLLQATATPLTKAKEVGRPSQKCTSARLTLRERPQLRQR